MASTILDTPAHTGTAGTSAFPTNFAPSAGRNRIAYLAVLAGHGSNASPATACTISGQSLSVLATVDDDANSSDVALVVFYALESVIAAAVSSDAACPVSITGGTSGSYACIYWSVQDAYQGAPAYTGLATSTANTTNSLSLARVADSVTVGISLHDIGANGFTSLADPANDAEDYVANGNFIYGSETDTARTASMVWVAGTSRQNVSIVINTAPVGGASPSGLRSGLQNLSNQFSPVMAANLKGGLQ